ncbi:hypothetical protein QU38_01205, partial [Staphylococcus aureus]
VDHDLRAIGEVAELGFPQHQRLRVGERIAIFEAEHAIFAERRIQHLERPVRDGREGHVAMLVLLVDPDGVALREGAAARILTREANAISFGEQRTEGQRLAGRPVEILAALEHRALGVEHAAERLVDLEVGGNFGQRAAQA